MSTLKEKLNILFSYNNGILSYRTKKAGHIYPGKNAGVLQKNGYLSCGINKKKYYIHRLIWIYHNGNINNNLFLDHLDGNRLNNKIENLRLVTAKVNCENSVGKGWTYIKGRAKPYLARIVINKKVKCLGYFISKEEANLAYINAKNMYHDCTQIRSFYND